MTSEQYQSIFGYVQSVILKRHNRFCENKRLEGRGKGRVEVCGEILVSDISPPLGRHEITVSSMGYSHLILPKLLTRLSSLLVFSGLNIFEANNNSVKFKLR